MYSTTVNRHARYGHRRKPPSVFLIFTLGLVSATQVQLIGYLSIVEIIFLLLTPFYIITRWRTLTNSQLWPFLILILGWFFSAVATDLWRETDLSLLLKGAATPLLWASSLISMYFLLRERLDLIRWFVVGAAISGVVSMYVFKPGSVIGLESEVWGGEVGYDFRVWIGVWVTFVWAAVLFLHPRNPRWAVAIMLVFSLLCFKEGSRSAGAISLLVVGLMFFGGGLLAAGTRLQRKRTGARILVFGIMAIVIAFSISEGYRHAVFEGWLGDYERQRYIEQSQSIVGIMGARSEFASSMFAIADSPILGHGSWARDESGYRYMGAEALGVDVSGLHDVSDMLIPGHSHLWGPWVSHGFLGFLFWFYVFIYVLRFFINDMPYAQRYLPFVLLLTLGSFWNILFSPVGFRPLESAGYVFMIIFAENLRKARAEEALARRNYPQVERRP